MGCCSNRYVQRLSHRRRFPHHSRDVRTRAAQPAGCPPQQGDREGLPLQGGSPEGGTEAVVQERVVETLGPIVPGAYRLLAFALVRSKSYMWLAGRALTFVATSVLPSCTEPSM